MHLFSHYFQQKRLWGPLLQGPRGAHALLSKASAGPVETFLTYQSAQTFLTLSAFLPDIPNASRSFTVR